MRGTILEVIEALKCAVDCAAKRTHGQSKCSKCKYCYVGDEWSMCDHIGIMNDALDALYKNNELKAMKDTMDMVNARMMKAEIADVSVIICREPEAVDMMMRAYDQWLEGEKE